MSKGMEVMLHVLRYIGGKGRMAGVLSRLIPATCKVYAEMYCGSVALALNSRKFDLKIINDYNPHIANFWNVFTQPDNGEILLERLRETPYSRSVFMDAKWRRKTYGSKRRDFIQWAVDTYVLTNQSFNADGRNWTYHDNDGYFKKLNNPLGIPLVLQSINNQEFKVCNMDAVDCMKENRLLNNPQAFIYLDPPYLEGLRCDYSLYYMDMPDVRDHIDLLKTIRHAKAKIVLSGYWSGRDDGTDLYDFYLLRAGWHRHLLGEYSKGCEVAETRSKGAEWVWCNYDLSEEAPGAIDLLKSYCDDEKSPCICK